MKVSEWNKPATKLLEAFEYEISIKNGGKKMTTAQATKLNELQHAIGSRHGIHEVTYKEGKTTLDEMIGWVAQGLKTPPLMPG